MRLMILLALAGLIGPAAFAQNEPLRVAVVTGGHGYEKEDFLTLFRSMGGIRFRLIDPEEDYSQFLENIDEWPYDVLVLYNMAQDISEKRKQNLMKLLDKGVGLVVLHHAIANFNEWPEYWNIIGARYYLKPIDEPGNKHLRSQYKHGVDFHVKIADKEHPVTKGVDDFDITDETYKLYDVWPDNHVLLTTDAPTSEKIIGWTRKYKNSNVFFMQLGHDSEAYYNPSYRKLVLQAIKWAAKNQEP